MQPQHIWPYLQHNFIHPAHQQQQQHHHQHSHHHFPHPAFLSTQSNGNSCQPQTASSSSPGSTISDGENHTSNIAYSQNKTMATTSNSPTNINAAANEGALNDNDSNTCMLEDNNNRRLSSGSSSQEKLQQQQQHNSAHTHSPHITQQQQQQQQIIAKPMPSRPTPFLPHSLNHPHLHSLLAHCRNPYMSGKYNYANSCMQILQLCISLFARISLVCFEVFLSH